MLYRNRICMVASQNFKLMQRQYMQNNLQGNNISVLLPLGDIFACNTDMMNNFASEAYKLFICKGFCTEADFVSNYNQLAIYGVMMSNFVFGYNIKTGKMSLYTSSYSLLVQLASSGILVGKRKPIAEEIHQFEDALVTGSRIKTSIKNRNLIQTVRLDWEYQGNKLVFKGTVPKSQIDIRETQFVPYTSMDSAMQVLNEELQSRALRITAGDKVRVITKSRQILNMIYGEVRANTLLSCGYDARTNNFFAPSVGASIYTNGLTNIDLTAVDSIQEVTSLADIDLSEVKLDISNAPRFCAETLPHLSEQQLSAVADSLGVSTGGTKELTVKILTEAVYDRQAYPVYMMMKDTGFFDLNKFKALPSKWGSSSAVQQVEIPKSVQELEALLKTGVFRITLFTKTGRYSSVVCTNSYKALQKIYGEDYYRRFESYGNRLRMFNRSLEKISQSQPSLTREELVQLTETWGCYDLLSDVEDKYPSSETFTIKQVRDALVSEQYRVETRKTVTKQLNSVTARNCECKTDAIESRLYYKNIVLGAIRGIVKLA